MSEGIAYGDHASPTTRTQPTYGEGRLSYEPPPKAQEQLSRRSHTALAVAIFAPVVAAYGVAAYGLYLAANAVL